MSTMLRPEALTDTDRQALRARVRLSLCRSYLGDLEAEAAGDRDRFTRMVDGRGKQQGSRDAWIGFVVGILSDPDVKALEGHAEALGRAEALGIDVPDA